MNQVNQKRTQKKGRSPSWVLGLAVLTGVYLTLQWQQPAPPDPQDESVVQQQAEEASDGLGAIPASKQGEAPDQDADPESRTTNTFSTGGKGASQSASVSAEKMKLTPANANRPPPVSANSTVESKPTLGELRELSGQVWESTAGLKYGPGSREQHRLKHVMRHAADQPNRPGKHGVFNGAGKQQAVLALIDEAYLKALRGGRDVQKKKEGSRIVYTVEMRRPVGYVGGQVGRKQGNPAAHQIRLVLEGTNVITAFPL